MQNAPSQQKVIRVILAALLDSQLSPSELRQFGQSLSYGSGAEVLARCIEGVVSNLQGEKKPTKPKNEPDTRSADIEIALSLIKRRRLSKGAVLDLMRTGGAVRRSFPPGTSMRELVAEFNRTALPHQWQDFFLRLHGMQGGDPFLKGITSR